MQPVLGMILELLERGLHTGQRLTVLRRDLGDLFRDAGPVPLRVEASLQGWPKLIHNASSPFASTGLI